MVGMLFDALGSESLDSDGDEVECVRLRIKFDAQ